MTDRTRFALLIVLIVATIAARAGGALGAPHKAHKAHLHKIHAHKAHAHKAHAHKAHAQKAHAHERRRHKVHAHKAYAHRQPVDARIVAFAKHYLGVRYTWGGTSPATGFDCSGFTRFVYAHFGIALPHYSGAQFNYGRRVSHLRPGDLVFFYGLGHVGLYIGGGQIIHAPHTGSSVSIERLSYLGGYDGARRLIS